jgi:hypothetical protein
MPMSIGGRLKPLSIILHIILQFTTIKNFLQLFISFCNYCHLTGEIVESQFNRTIEVAERTIWPRRLTINGRSPKKYEWLQNFRLGLQARCQLMKKRRPTVGGMSLKKRPATPPESLRWGFETA